MSDHAKRNVVSLEDYGRMRRGLGSGPGTKALRDTRELAASKLKQSIGRMMEKVDDALFARAEKADNNASQTQYFDAMREMRIIREEIEDEFISGFYSRFNQGIPRPTAGDADFSLSLDDDGPGLVGNEDLEEQLAISNMVSKARNACKQSLFALDKRIGFLIRDPDLERWENPVGPDAVCEAFREAAQRIETGLEIRLVIFKLFDQYLIGELDETYKALNQQLINLGVLPEIKSAVNRSPQRGAPGAPGMPGDPGAPANGSDPAQPAPGIAGAGNAPVQGGGAGYAGAGAPYPGQAGGAPGQPGAPGGGVYHGMGQTSISALTFLQHGGGEVDYGSGGLSVDPLEMASGQVNILHGIKQSPLARDMGTGSDMTIDIVAMLFDYILDDKSIPDVMRALIGRLQIPVLKVALLDREFFSRKSHPARVLLNRLASTAMGWDEKLGPEDPLFRKVAEVVQTVLDEFEEDIGLFDGLLDDFDTFLRQEEERAQVRAERSAKVMEGQERLELARSTTMDEIEPRVADESNLQFVRDFVTTHWKNLLFIICARQGKDSDAWRQAVATMDDLIWSVKPKRDLEERKRLIALQPRLLGNLRAGMERLSIASTERDEFIAKLVHAHGRTAVNVATPDSDTLDDDATQATPEAQDAPVAEAAQPAEQTPPEVESQQAEPRPEPIDDEHTERVRNLAQGMWLEFRNGEGSFSRAKLSWISPITNTYLFTDRQGLKAGNYSVDELAELMRRARARIINDTPLMDRAVGTVLKNYQKPE